MTRVIAIVVGLAVGLLGLFMSVCGGGLLVAFGYDTVRMFFVAHRSPGDVNGLFPLLLPAGSLVLGIFVCRSAYLLLRKNFKEEE